MSLEPETKYFDVVGPGYVSEEHADERHRYLPGSENKAVRGALVWLAFYAVALVVVVLTNFEKAADFAMAATN